MVYLYFYFRLSDFSLRFGEYYWRLFFVNECCLILFELFLSARLFKSIYLTLSFRAVSLNCFLFFSNWFFKKLCIDVDCSQDNEA